jgi:hypothetical protein
VRQVHTYLVSLPSARAASHHHSPVRQRITKPLKVRDGLQKTRFFLQLALCLSRACLGEMVVSTLKWLQKGVFCTSAAASDPSLLVTLPSACTNARLPALSLQAPHIFNFSYGCPEPVLANIRFSV